MKASTPSPRTRSNGFGLLEAIVALALFAGVGMALFAWINNNLATAARLRETESFTRATMLAIEWVQTINPATDPRGDVVLDEGVHLTWEARTVTPRTDVVPFSGGENTPFEVALFEVELVVRHPEVVRDLDLTQHRLGIWREPVDLIFEDR